MDENRDPERPSIRQLIYLGVTFVALGVANHYTQSLKEHWKEHYGVARRLEQHADTNRNGRLTREEISSMLTEMGYSLTGHPERDDYTITVSDERDIEWSCPVQLLLPLEKSKEYLSKKSSQEEQEPNVQN